MGTNVETNIKESLKHTETKYSKPEEKNDSKNLEQDYENLKQEFNNYKKEVEIKTSENFRNVKPKFIDTVYQMLDKTEEKESIAKQLINLKNEYGEFFVQKNEEKIASEPINNFDKNVDTFLRVWGYKK